MGGKKSEYFHPCKISLHIGLIQFTIGIKQKCKTIETGLFGSIVESAVLKMYPEHPKVLKMKSYATVVND